MKSVQIRFVFSCIQSKYRKIRPEKTPYLDPFHPVLSSRHYTNVSLLTNISILYPLENIIKPKVKIGTSTRNRLNKTGKYLFKVNNKDNCAASISSVTSVLVCLVLSLSTKWKEYLYAGYSS